MNIAVFASHNGSDLQAIIDGCKTEQIMGQVCVVISNNSDAYALVRAENNHIAHYHISAKAMPIGYNIDEVILNTLRKHNTDIIVLAGYLKKLGSPVLQAYHDRIFNIHPALLPKYGGKGMYGLNVHKAVIESGDTVSGITIHKVNENYDEGDIIAQTKVDVLKGDTAEILAERILAREHTFLVEVIGEISKTI